MSETEVTTEAQIEVNDDLDVFTKDFFGQKDEVQEPASSETEQEDKTEAKVVETEAQTADLEDDETEEVIETPVPKKNRTQERIDELVRQREDAKRENEAIRKEMEEIRKVLKPVEPEKKADTPDPDAVNADGTPKYPLGDYDPNYIRDLTHHTLETERVQANIKIEEERKQREAQVQETALVSSWNEKLAPAKEKYPDLETKGQNLLNSFSNLDQGYAKYLSTVLMSMDHGPDVLYYLASNPDEAVKIVNSGAQRATLALGRIEAKYIEAEQQKQAAKPKISKAPIPPAQQNRGTGGGRPSIEGDTDDLKAFEKTFFSK